MKKLNNETIKKKTAKPALPEKKSMPPNVPTVTLTMPADIANLVISGLRYQDPTGTFIGPQIQQIEIQLAKQLMIEPKPPK